MEVKYIKSIRYFNNKISFILYYPTPEIRKRHFLVLHYIYYDFWFVSFVKHGTNNMVLVWYNYFTYKSIIERNL